MSTEAAEEIYAVLAAVIAATSEVTSRPKLLARYDDADPTPNRPVTKSDGDSPLHVLEYAGCDDAAFTTDENYDNGETWVELTTHNYRLTIQGKPGDFRLSTVLPYWRAVRSGLRELGPTLGLEYVERFGPLSATSRIADGSEDVAKGSKRRILEVTIPVVVNIDGDDLTE